MKHRTTLGGRHAMAACCLFAGALAALASGLPAASSAADYPLKKSANGRYLVDQNDVPYLIVGESPQALIVNVTEAEAEMFIANRSAHGFNTLWVNLLCATYTGGRVDGSTIDDILPFTGTIPSTSSYDLTTPNEAYFAHVGRILELAAAYGMQVLLDPCETGSWLSVMLDNGPAKCRNYGRYLGTRYRDFDNIIWMSGNDFQGWRDPANDEVVRSVALGILDNDARHLHTAELDYLVSSSLDDARWMSILGLNATYTYYPTYARLRQDYNRSNFLPNFMVEANYEFESLQGPTTTAPILRKQEYWAMTSGVAGQLYGNGYTWPFAYGWQNHLDTPGAIQIGYLKTFFEPRAWYELVPDTAHTLVTGGYGTYSDDGYVNNNDYLTAARTSDGTLAIVYTPIIRSFTVDMSKLSAAATTRWYDPSSGAYVAVPGSPFPNAGSRGFTPPENNSDGDGGWVLVLETQPVETEPPDVALTAPARDATVLGTGTVSATATDDVGVVGVQFRVDGTNIGPEDQSAPYAVSWNTLSTPNGPHVVKAIARDLAGNRGTDSVSVTVANVIPPPPTDHLAAAYAFDESGGATTADESGNDNFVTLHGPAFAAGKNGNALVFDGGGDFAEAPNSASLNIGGTGLTIAFWVLINSTSSGVDYVIVGKPWFATAMTSPFYQYGVEYSNGYNRTLDFYFGDASAGLHGPHRMSPTIGSWTHVVFTYDGSTVKGYLDGVERLSETDVSSLVPRGHSLRFGVDGAYQQFFNGALDDLRIYSRALTLVEIQSVMQTAVGEPVTGVEEKPAGAGDDSAVELLAPNPTGGHVSVAYRLARAGEVRVSVYDVAGRLVARPLALRQGPGSQRASWDGRTGDGARVSPGVYFMRVTLDGARIGTRRIVVSY